MHDVGKTKLKSSKLFKKDAIREDILEEWHKHAKLSVPIAKRFLKRQGHSEEFISEVLYLIENHDMRGEKIKNKSLELQILQDADLLADEGFTGFIKPFLYGTKFQRPIIGSIKHMQEKTNRLEKGDINLTISKKLAKEKLRRTRELLKEIGKDIQSDVL